MILSTCETARDPACHDPRIVALCLDSHSCEAHIAGRDISTFSVVPSVKVPFRLSGSTNICSGDWPWSLWAAWLQRTRTNLFWTANRVGRCEMEGGACRAPSVHCRPISFIREAMLQGFMRMPGSWEQVSADSCQLYGGEDLPTGGAHE